MYRTLASLAFALGVIAPSVPARAATPSVALLPLVFSAASDDYTLVPKAAELTALTDALGAGLSPGLALVPIARHDSGGCVDAGCARRLAHDATAQSVVFGTVARSAGPRWTTQVTIVDVRSGRTIDAFTFATPGDYASLLAAERHVGDCVRRSILRRPRCKSDASQR